MQRAKNLKAAPKQYSLSSQVDWEPSRPLNRQHLITNCSSTVCFVTHFLCKTLSSKHWLPNLPVLQIPLRACLKRLLHSHLSYTGWVGLGRGQKICISKSSQVILLLLGSWDLTSREEKKKKTALKTAFFPSFSRRNNLATVSLQEKLPFRRCLSLLKTVVPTSLST